MLGVKVGDEVYISGGSGNRIVRVDHVTPSGRFRAGGLEFDPNGRQRGEIGWSIRLWANHVTDAHRQEMWRREALGRLLSLREVADSLTDDQLRRMIAILDE